MMIAEHDRRKVEAAIPRRHLDVYSLYIILKYMFQRQFKDSRRRPNLSLRHCHRSETIIGHYHL